MNNYSEKVVENFKTGYNCAQSVFLAFAKDCGVEDDTALKLASSFGGGMGRLREVCGAVTAMFAIAGLKKGYISVNNDDAKAEHYKLIQKLAEDFKVQHKTIICRELLGLPDGESDPTPSKRNEEYYQDRPCENFIRTAAIIIEKELLD